MRSQQAVTTKLIVERSLREMLCVYNEQQSHSLLNAFVRNDSYGESGKQNNGRGMTTNNNNCISGYSRIILNQILSACFSLVEIVTITVER